MRALLTAFVVEQLLASGSTRVAQTPFRRAAGGPRARSLRSHIRRRNIHRRAAPQPYARLSPRSCRLRYQEGDPIPLGYHVVDRSRQDSAIAGTIRAAARRRGSRLSVANDIDDFKDGMGSLAVPSFPGPGRRCTLDVAELRQLDRQWLRRAGSRDESLALLSPRYRTRRRSGGGRRDARLWNGPGRQLLSSATIAMPSCASRPREPASAPLRLRRDAARPALEARARITTSHRGLAGPGTLTKSRFAGPLPRRDSLSSRGRRRRR